MVEEPIARVPVNGSEKLSPVTIVPVASIIAILGKGTSQSGSYVSVFKYVLAFTSE